jgi:hypothetical protein
MVPIRLAVFDANVEISMRPLSDDPRVCTSGHLQSFVWTPRRTFRRRLRCRQRTFSRRRVIGILISLSPEYSVSDGRSELSNPGAKRISPSAT